MQHTPNRSKPSMRCRFWWPSNPQKTRRLSNQGTSGIHSLSSGSNPDPDAQQTILSVFKSVLSVAEQLMAAGATDEEVKNISQIMAQTVRKLEGGSTLPEPGIEALKLACDMVVLDADFLSCIPGFSSMNTEGPRKPSRGVCRTQPQKRDAWRRSASKRKMSYNLLCLWHWIHRSSFLPHAFQSW